MLLPKNRSLIWFSCTGWLQSVTFPGVQFVFDIILPNTHWLQYPFYFSVRGSRMALMPSLSDGTGAYASTMLKFLSITTKRGM